MFAEYLRIFKEGGSQDTLCLLWKGGGLLKKHPQDDSALVAFAIGRVLIAPTSFVFKCLFKDCSFHLHSHTPSCD